jgi:hypothetical protein
MLEIDRYCRQSGLVAQSLDVVRPDFGRWVRELRRRGVTSIPPVRSKRPEDALASNILILLIKQSMHQRNAAVEHELRNLVRVRPYKP